MPFIPHTEKDTREMLDAIGAETIADLFDEIPKELMIEHLEHVPDALSEMEVSRLMRDRAAQDGAPVMLYRRRCLRAPHPDSCMGYRNTR